MISPGKRCYDLRFIKDGNEPAADLEGNDAKAIAERAALGDKGFERIELAWPERARLKKSLLSERLCAHKVSKVTRKY